MLNTRLLSLLVSYAVAMLFFVLVYPTSYALAQNETTDDGLTTETTDDGLTTETTDDGLTTETTDDGLTINDSSTPGRKATLIVRVDVVGGTAEVSDFTIQVISSSTDNSIEWEQYPQIFEGDSNVILRVSDIPSSQFNYEVKVIDQPSGDYSPKYEGCNGTWELGGYKTCKITNYFEPQPLPDFQIVANPEELNMIPESSDYSTLTLIPLEDNSRDAIMNIQLDTKWIGTPPDNNDVSVTIEQGSTRLVGTQRQDIGMTIQTSQDAPPGQTFTLSVIADGEVDQQDHPVSHTANIQITIPPGNNPPKAIAILDKQGVEEGESVKLDGTGSTDLDGDDLTYSWEVLRGPADVHIPDDISYNPSLVYETPRVDEDTTITFQLTVFDSKPGGIGIDRTELSIEDLGSNPPNGDERTNPLTDALKPLTDAIPPEIRDVAGGFIPPVSGPSSNNLLPLLVLAAVIVIGGGIAIGKYKMNRRSSRRVKIPPSAIVDIKTRGGIGR